MQGKFKASYLIDQKSSLPPTASIAVTKRGCRQRLTCFRWRCDWLQLNFKLFKALYSPSIKKGLYEFGFSRKGGICEIFARTSNSAHEVDVLSSSVSTVSSGFSPAAAKTLSSFRTSSVTRVASNPRKAFSSADAREPSVYSATPFKNFGKCSAEYCATSDPTRHNVNYQMSGTNSVNRNEITEILQFDRYTKQRRHHIAGSITLRFLKQLKRSGVGSDDLLYFYVTVIRTVLEYACPVWHSSLTAAQTKALESLQRRAMRVIFQDNDYTMSRITAGLETLESRRDQLSERFFQRSVLPESSCLHYLLPDKRDSSVTDRLRHPRNFETLKTRTAKFQNFLIPYSLTHFL